MFLYVLVNVFLVPVAFDEGSVTAATCKSKCEGERVSCVSECAEDDPDTDENEYAVCVNRCGFAKSSCVETCGGCESTCTKKTMVCTSACINHNRDDEDDLRECCGQCSKDHQGCFEKCGIDAPTFTCTTGGGL